VNQSAFLKAAERLDRVVKSVKGNQLAATGAAALVSEDPPVHHPEEAWARRYATHPFRPVKDLEVGAPPLSAFVAPLVEEPRLQPVPDVPAAAVRDAPAGGHIGSSLGKPGPRRSWISRMFRGPA